MNMHMSAKLSQTKPNADCYLTDIRIVSIFSFKSYYIVSAKKKANISLHSSWNGTQLFYSPQH